MPMLWLMKRVQRRYERHGMVITYSLPEAGLWVDTGAEMAERAANRLRAHIQESLRAGRDAHGTTYHLAGSSGRVPSKTRKGGRDARLTTQQRREYDRTPPKRSHTQGRYRKTRGVRAQAVEFVDGKVHRGKLYTVQPGETKWVGSKKLRASRRYAKRFPAGGSKGGSGFFVDSGLLVNGLGVDVNAAAGLAAITVPPARAAAVNALEAEGIYPLGIAPEVMDAQLQETLDRAMGTWAGGGSSPAGLYRAPGALRLVGGAVLRGILQGL